MLFKKGDRVISEDYGKGIVVSTNSTVKDKPIEVQFDNDDEGKTLCYTIDGREHKKGSGYRLKGKFFPVGDQICLTKLQSE